MMLVNHTIYIYDTAYSSFGSTGPLALSVNQLQQIDHFANIGMARNLVQETRNHKGKMVLQHIRIERGGNALKRRTTLQEDTTLQVMMQGWSTSAVLGHLRFFFPGLLAHPIPRQHA
ncbi:MAG: hypothetical protein FRX48_01554 [Lasallia pustulata]|uniref:Uncharacterized protein n=1 Tax=Lasallia pustulata TaxID=136370 RepID=A0A5M8Q1F4_9LECA|nr:MAG: hypothetical protein FRX48_01554 [Lasallia pustulata]